MGVCTIVNAIDGILDDGLMGWGTRCWDRSDCKGREQLLAASFLWGLLCAKSLSPRINEAQPCKHFGGEIGGDLVAVPFVDLREQR